MRIIASFANIFGFVAAIALTSLGTRPATAATTTFIALLNGGQEVPPNTSNASGIAFLTFDGKQLCFAITTTIGAQETAAHIHGPAAPGVTAGILFSLDAGRAKNGCWSSPATSVKKALKKGRLYLNIHTDEFPNGEIRGQILKTN
jgi:hypothetical protein